MENFPRDSLNISFLRCTFCSAEANRTSILCFSILMSLWKINPSSHYQPWLRDTFTTFRLIIEAGFKFQSSSLTRTSDPVLLGEAKGWQHSQISATPPRKLWKTNSLDLCFSFTILLLESSDRSVNTLAHLKTRM